MMLDHVLCPECHLRIELDDEARTALEEKCGREWEVECADGHVLSLHDGVMTTRLQPNHYNIFWHIQGIESDQRSLLVGDWHIVKLSRPFEKIDEIKTIAYPEEDGYSLRYVQSAGRFDNTQPDHFLLMTSGKEEEWGRRVRVDWTVYGAVPGSANLEIWRENLIFAARQFLSSNYRPCILQSAVAVESFVYELVEGYLEGRWDRNSIDRYVVDSKSRDRLPLLGVIKVCIEEIMGLKISHDLESEWKRLRGMRNALAHGDLGEYRSITDLNGRRFASERERARFAYQAAVRFIYELRYPTTDDI